MKRRGEKIVEILKETTEKKHKSRGRSNQSYIYSKRY